MVEKTLLLIILSAGMLLYDFPKFKKTNRRERIVYVMLMIPVVYLSLVYVLRLPWPTLDELIHFIFAKPAQQIVDSIKAPK
ncbi:hypothetical protein [Metabacillus sp. Hm71]|uniref:hypothetical protein n=1 Tax=Metabacillus sp. Hm71 TaxID=3450743 RepID=UPI003F41E465